MPVRLHPKENIPKIQQTEILTESSDETTVEEYLKSKNQNYKISFFDQAQHGCIGMVDMVNSTRISIRLSGENLAKYYEIFLNEMAHIIERFDGMIIKNIGDSLLYYFPEDSRNEGFINCVKCGISIIDEYKSINEKMHKTKLPSLNYRVSSDYGSVKIMKVNNSYSIDVIGTAVNFCTKINHCASKNEFIIGGDMYHMVKNSSEFNFKLKKMELKILNYAYPVYTVDKK